MKKFPKAAGEESFCRFLTPLAAAFGNLLMWL
jgi:hypothetical protein